MIKKIKFIKFIKYDLLKFLGQELFFTICEFWPDSIV